MTRMRQGKQSILSVSLVIAAVLIVTLSVSAPAAAAKGNLLEEQLAFGIQMAKRGLWNEAVFRFARVLEERPGDVRVLNNMAVAYEAIGEFDLALEHYKRALEGDSSNRELRRNYAQFVEFYESLRPDAEGADSEAVANEDATEAEAVEAVEESAEDGSTEPDSPGR